LPRNEKDEFENQAFGPDLRRTLGLGDGLRNALRCRTTDGRTRAVNALNATSPLEPQADRVDRPGGWIYPTGIKLWRAFADQAG